MADTREAIVVQGVHRTFQESGSPVRALRGVDLSVARNEFIAVMGASGSGKSTLLNIVAGLDTPSEGHVTVADTALSGLTEDELAVFRSRQIGMVFQFFNLLDGLTAAENVGIAVLAAGGTRRHARSRTREVLDMLGLSARASVPPSELSGGERQRLAIARALANDPPVILADEPTGALDSTGAAEVLELLRRVHHDGHTIVLVTHDQAIAATADRTVELRDGVIAGREPVVV